MPILETKQLTMRFGGLTAVDAVDFAVERGKIVSIIGPNGAGKTTFFNCLTGLYCPTSGEVTFQSRDITGCKPHRVTELGVARTFQNIRLFAEMTALENVMVGMHCRTHTGVVARSFGRRASATKNATRRRKRWTCCGSPGLSRKPTPGRAIFP